MTMREWLTRARDWLSRERLDAELDEELAFHTRMLERDGHTPGSASRALGSTLRLKAEARERWSLPTLDRLLGDVRHAARGLRRSPSFTIAAVVTLGLGVGANAAMLDVVDGLMFRPAPYLRDVGAVHRVYLRTVRDGVASSRVTFPYTRYLDLSRWTHSFSATAAFTRRPLAVGAGLAAREREVAGVSASLFPFFEARPTLGRFFVASDDATPHGARVVVLSHAFWTSEFQRANVLGRALQVGTVTCTIVGVAPPGFVGVPNGPAPAVFIPITTFPEAAAENKANTYWTAYNWDWTSMVARRRPDVSVEAASADLTAAWARSREVQRGLGAQASDNVRHEAIAGPLRTAAGPDAGLESRTLLWVAGVALVVLLVAGANVTNLVLARALVRRRETAMRRALGVTRGRLLSRAVAEGALLAAAGGAVGVLVAWWGSAALRLLVAPEAMDGTLGTRTFAAAAVLALGAGIVAAAAPALIGSGDDLAGTLRAGGRGVVRGRSRLRAGLLVAQAALSVVLLVGAALFVQSMRHVQAVRLGYDAEQVLIATPNLRGLQLDSAATIAFRRRLLVAAQDIPGVLHAARINSLPFGTNTTTLVVPGIDSVEALGRFDYQTASADYFATMGTRIVRGRGFTDADREGAPPVVVVSASMARTLWPGRDPLGMCIHVGSATGPCRAVVGIAEDAIQHGFVDDARRTYYLPLEEYAPSWGNRILLRVDEQHAERVRAALQARMPGQGYVTVEPLAALVDVQRRSWRLGATMFVAFGGLALVVAAVGLYGVVAYDVAQRSHELGVRVALGASWRAVARLVVGEGVSLALVGVAIGLVGALAASRWVQPLLFEQSARDPFAYGGVAFALALVAALASALPAARAARADPNQALRDA